MRYHCYALGKVKVKVCVCGVLGGGGAKTHHLMFKAPTPRLPDLPVLEKFESSKLARDSTTGLLSI